MNTISQNQMIHTTEGSSLYNNKFNNVSTFRETNVVNKTITLSGAQVAQNIEQSIAQTKADVQELQKMSDMVAGNKLQFSVNKELKSVVVSVVDSSTNEILKQIPSVEIQNLKIRIRKAIGRIFDQTV